MVPSAVDLQCRGLEDIIYVNQQWLTDKQFSHSRPVTVSMDHMGQVNWCFELRSALSLAKFRVTHHLYIIT